jgi:Golgi phosphoprotein 3 (GPP34)
MHERRAARPAGRGYPGPLDAGLSGTGLVADDLYLLAHDDRTGKPLLPPRPLGTGLAGALLTELMLARCIGLRSDAAVVTGQDVPPAVVAGHVLLTLIAGEPSPLPVRAWLGFLSQTAARDVALRLEQAGYLTRVRSRVPGRPGRMVPVNPDWAFAPMLRVRSALDRAREPAPHAGVLTGLAVACGLGFRLDQYQTGAGRSTVAASTATPSGSRSW